MPQTVNNDLFGKHRSQSIFEFPTVNLHDAGLPPVHATGKVWLNCRTYRYFHEDAPEVERTKDPDKVLIDMDCVEPRCTRHTWGRKRNGFAADDDEA